MGAAAKPLGGAIQAGKSTAYQCPLGLTRPLPCASAPGAAFPKTWLSRISDTKEFDLIA